MEDVIHTHHAIREAAVFGVNGPYRGEIVKAYVILNEGMEDPVSPEEIISFCKKQIAAYKYPRNGGFVPEMSKTITRKILRRSLRKSGSVQHDCIWNFAKLNSVYDL